MAAAGGWLVSSDLAKISATSRTEKAGASRQLAAYRIRCAWLAWKAERWLNRVINDCKRFHAFARRLEVNFEPAAVHFGHGLASLDYLLAKSRIVRLAGKLPMCPFCKTEPIAMGCFFVVGKFCFRSTPHLLLGCTPCTTGEFRAHKISWRDRECFVYDQPLLTRYAGPKHNDTTLYWSPLLLRPLDDADDDDDEEMFYM